MNTYDGPILRTQVEIDSTYGPTNAVLMLPRQTWNGFEVPYFPRESVDRLIALGEDLVTRDEIAADHMVRLSWEGDRVRHDDPAYEDEPVYDAPVLINGVKHWPVGAAAWIWRESDVNEPVPDIALDDDLGCYVAHLEDYRLPDITADFDDLGTYDSEERERIDEALRHTDTVSWMDEAVDPHRAVLLRRLDDAYGTSTFHPTVVGDWPDLLLVARRENQPDLTLARRALRFHLRDVRDEWVLTVARHFDRMAGRG